jgi:hypothetical protein
MGELSSMHAFNGFAESSPFFARMHSRHLTDTDFGITNYVSDHKGFKSVVISQGAIGHF